jgi:hypothetical protein
LPSTQDEIGVRGLNGTGDLLTFESLSHTVYLLRGDRVLRVKLRDGSIVLDDVRAINNSAWIVGRASGGPLGSLHVPVLLKPAA